MIALHRDDSALGLENRAAAPWQGRTSPNKKMLLAAV
jgi:hypothetical protein